VVHGSGVVKNVLASAIIILNSFKFKDHLFETIDDGMACTCKVLENPSFTAVSVATVQQQVLARTTV
jgi:hypothetical protein